MFTESLFTTSALTVLFRPPCRSPGPSGGQSKRPMDKKLRRQIANCNERRRMQSINAGFHTLRVLMPHLQGEKLSKVCNLHTGGRCVCQRSNCASPYFRLLYSNMQQSTFSDWIKRGSDSSNKTPPSVSCSLSTGPTVTQAPWTRSQQTAKWTRQPALSVLTMSVLPRKSWNRSLPLRRKSTASRQSWRGRGLAGSCSRLGSKTALHRRKMMKKTTLNQTSMNSSRRGRGWTLRQTQGTTWTSLWGPFARLRETHSADRQPPPVGLRRGALAHSLPSPLVTTPESVLSLLYVLHKPHLLPLYHSISCSSSSCLPALPAPAIIAYNSPTIPHRLPQHWVQWLCWPHTTQRVYSITFSISLPSHLKRLLLHPHILILYHLQC